MPTALIPIHARRFYLWLCFAAFMLTACTPTKYNMMQPYLEQDSTVTLAAYPFSYQEPVIKKYDLVRVQFAGMNPTVTALLNSYGGADLTEKETGPAAQTSFAGQQVDGNGELNFPLIGKVMAEGKTKGDLREELLRKVTPILRDPYVLVELPKRGVTVLGEVLRPGSVVFPKERANLFETLAAAGHTTEFADLEKIKVYREEAGGQRLLATLNLHENAFLQSPYFYPSPDDVIYVPASKLKTVRNNSQTYLQFATLGIALISVLVTVFR